MDLDIRTLNAQDYDEILVKWWEQWNWKAPERDFLPENGTGGIIIFDGEIPICAGFLYVTNSKVAWVDFIISSKEYREKVFRRKALKLLINTLTNIAKNTGNKYVYALIKHKSLIKVYEEEGYIQGDSYTSEMIKVF